MDFLSLFVQAFATGMTELPRGRTLLEQFVLGWSIDRAVVLGDGEYWVVKLKLDGNT